MSENTSIKKRSENIKKHGADLRKIEEELKCECNHKTKENTYSLVPNRNGDKHYTHVCTQCGKQIHINKYAEEKIREATTVVDDVCDLVKMMAKPNQNENDEKLYKRIVKVQFAVRNTLGIAYRNCLSMNSNAAKKKNNSGATIITSANRQ